MSEASAADAVGSGRPAPGPTGDAVHLDTEAAPVDTGAALTGDLVIDAALGELLAQGPDDLDAQVAAGERLQRALHERLSDLGT